MIDLLDCPTAHTRALPLEKQGKVARMLLLYAGEAELVTHLTAAEEADLTEAEAEADRGKFATDEEVRAIFAQHQS